MAHVDEQENEIGNVSEDTTEILYTQTPEDIELTNREH